MCGEKGGGFWGNRQGEGSPPRVRGKGPKMQCLKSAMGITPACAGKSFWISSRFPPAWDHPRVCGEKTDSLFVSLLYLGSPPRVRGKATDGSSLSTCTGITPACAGKSDA